MTMVSMGNIPFQLQMTSKQAILFGGKMWTCRGRASDKDRRLLFADEDGITRDFTDRQILKLQMERKVKFLSASQREAIERERAGSKPRAALDRCNKEERKHVERLQHYIRAWKSAGCPGRSEAKLLPIIAKAAAELPDPKPISVRSLQRALALDLAYGGDPEMLLRQCDLKGNRADRLKKYRCFLRDAVAEHYLVSPKPSFPAVYANVLGNFEDHDKEVPSDEKYGMPSKSAVYEEMRKIDGFTKTFCHRGPEEAEHHHRLLEDGPDVQVHNQSWEFDHTTVDLIVLDGETGLPIGRPFITMAIDRATSMIMGYHISWAFPGIEPTVECLRNAFLPKDSSLAKVSGGLRNPWPAMGKPVELVPDNAKHFRSEAFKLICLGMGIDVARPPVGKAWYKGKIERAFGTLARGMFHLVPGTTFSNIFQRLKEKPPETVAVCTLAELEALLVHYIVDIFNARRNRIMNTSPLLSWGQSVNEHGLQIPPNPDDLAVKLSIPYFRKASREGILFEGLLYKGPELVDVLIRPKGDRVQIKVDPSDLTRIWFIHPETKRPIELPIQRSSRNRVKGMNLDLHRMALSMQRNNPDLLAGEEGIHEAYRIITAMLKEKSRADGLANRRIAAKHLDGLRQRAEAYVNEDVQEFEVRGDHEATHISGDLLPGVELDQEEAIEQVTSGDGIPGVMDEVRDVIPEKKAGPPTGKRGRKSAVQAAPVPGPAAPPNPQDDDDLDAYMKGKVSIYKPGET